MKHLISLPPNASSHFHEITGKSSESWFTASDPEGLPLGSGGGTAWLLSELWNKEAADSSFSNWLSKEKRIIIHAGGQSRRLPAYGPLGKLQLPIPVFRWERGQKLSQTLLDLQLPLLKRLLEASPKNTHTLLASGDALIRSNLTIDLPDTDVISFGIPVDPALAANHGVFICERGNRDNQLHHMRQKPYQQELRDLAADYLFYIDIGIWLLSDRAVKIIMQRSGWSDKKSCYTQSAEYGITVPDFYDFYGNFGLGLGTNPTQSDKAINNLSTAIVRIPDGEFYHFGSSREVITSSLELQNKVQDQERIWNKNIKPHPSMFIQNADSGVILQPDQKELWIENSTIGSKWRLHGSHVITGIPKNDWEIDLPKGVCLDIIPLSQEPSSYAIRPYGLHDAFRGGIKAENTLWMGAPFMEWLDKRYLSLRELGIDPETDMQDAPLFPVIHTLKEIEPMILFMLDPSMNSGSDPYTASMATLWLESPRLSANDLLHLADIVQLSRQRKELRLQNYAMLRKNYRRSVFYQIDLHDAARELSAADIPVPPALSGDSPAFLSMHDAMFRSKWYLYKNGNGEENEKTAKLKSEAFSILQERIIAPFREKKVQPKLGVYEDQIVWGRSPVRIDLAGGWTDTPPHSILSGGKVVTIALELNGQPPLQTYIRPTEDKGITLRSIDLGARETITSYDDISGYAEPGSPFAIPKAALALTGFHPDFSEIQYRTLAEQLDDFGSGLEISFLSAVPKGSGMGTSSILAGTILGALSDFASLNWDRTEICNRTLALEQLLTTGGGWQDQYGGILQGVKLLETTFGVDQTPQVKWLPDMVFTKPEYRDSMLLYYTGVTRIAKNLLAEIVEGMFLNEHERSQVLKEMLVHAKETADTIQAGDYERLGKKIEKSWILNNRLDADTNNAEVQKVIEVIDDLSIGYKLPGAGGGGFLYILAKDPDAAKEIRKRLQENPPNRRARFVDMSVSNAGMQISRS